MIIYVEDERLPYKWSVWSLYRPNTIK